MKDFAVIFDNDGVLVDSEGYSLEAYRAALKEQGVTIMREDDMKYCGLTDAGIVNIVRQAYGADIDLEQFSKRKGELYYEIAGSNEMHPFPGVRRLIEELRLAGIPCLLASSGSRKKIAFNLSRAHIGDLFDIIISGEDFKRGKPAPDIFISAAERSGVKPACCAVIEDSINGLLAARDAGTFAIGVTNTFPRETLAPHADMIIDSLDELNHGRIRSMLCSTAN
ncbi:MAG: HAD family phosphatase [bacterium]|nr:HAD family phosphatase [Candidatus Sumerlaeota bacterium]